MTRMLRQQVPCQKYSVLIVTETWSLLKYMHVGTHTHTHTHRLWGLFIIIIIIISDYFYVALFSCLEQTHCTHVTSDSEWVTVSFYHALFNIHRSGVLTALFGCCMAGATWNCCRLGACSVYAIQPHTSSRCHFMQSHIVRVHVCSAVTCHLHFWQNDREISGATAIFIQTQIIYLSNLMHLRYDGTLQQQQNTIHLIMQPVLSLVNQQPPPHCRQ